jgi:serine/threonine protein phosphatase PrpC
MIAEQQKTSVRLQWFGLTDRGKVRRNNEDAFLCLQFDALELHYLGKIGDAASESLDFVFAVSDGMGGAMAGEFASRVTVDKITRLLPPAFKRSAAGLPMDFEDVFEELFSEIHRALTYLGSSDPDCSGMGATLSMCWFTPGWMYFAHIGDSRIYYLPKEGTALKQVSHDDTYVGWLFRNAKISEWEARQHPARNSLQRALGAGHQFVNPQVGAVGCESGDLFLLCTDGLVDGLFDSQILDILQTTRPFGPNSNPAQRLVQTAVAQAGRDNTTALVIEAL